MTESVKSPERIWIESEGGCPYFYHEDELSGVGSPVTEYVRADKLQAEIERIERLEELLRQALEALEQIATDLPWELTGLQADTITALRERLDEKE